MCANRVTKVETVEGAEARRVEVRSAVLDTIALRSTDADAVAGVVSSLVEGWLSDAWAAERDGAVRGGR